MAIGSVVLAIALVILGLMRIDVAQVRNRDSLRLSSASRALSTDPALLAKAGWTSLRGERLNATEAREDQVALERAANHVQVGVYANSTYDLELNIPSYSSNGYVWLRWDEPLQRYFDAQNTSIDRRFTLLNGLLSNADPVLRPLVERPVRLADGSFYQLFNYLGRFYIDRASFRHFPFMTVSLPLVLEVEDVDGGLDYTSLRLEPDLQNSGMGLYAGIIGWLNRGWSIAEYRHHYATNFGLGGAENDYSQVVFDISFGISAWAAFWRLLLPLAVLMVMVLLVFKVRPDEQDARASIPVTVLLTLVFLQQTYRAELPQLPFLTFLDQVYVVAYVITLMAFVLVIWIGRRYADMEAMPDGEGKEILQQRLHRLDDIWPLAMVLISGLSIWLCWVSLPPGG
ncbi:hypothetical protein KQ310_12940 [Synechococcus sp. CS-1328]|nr:hypothetical protein [Synechococcus sp. CS-1328]